MTEEQLHIVQEINTSDLCSIISSRNSSLEDEIRRLKNENKLLSERCNQLLADKGKLTDENAELRLKLKALEGQTPWKDIKDKSELIGKFTKAKEIIKKFSEFVNNEIEYDPEHSQEHTDLWNELCEQAEQFLKGENIILEDAQAGNSPFDADEVFNKEMKAYP